MPTQATRSRMIQDFFLSAFDRRSNKQPSRRRREPPRKGPLPKSVWEAVARGARNVCPKCAGSKLFPRYLKPLMLCPACGQNWEHQRADDFPAYVSILLTGHIMAPIIIMLVRDADLSSTALVAIILPLAMTLMIGLLQPAKGGIIALQWWLGMHGFERDTIVPPLDDQDLSPRR
jgi:uncharacterized protein (DUF983 family)